MRAGADAVSVDPDYFALGADDVSSLEQSREAEAELAGRVRLSFVQADANYENAHEEAVRPDDTTHAVSTSQLPMSLTLAEGRQVTERWLAESTTSRDMIRMSLPPSQIGIGAGDIVELPADGNEGGGLFRVDRIEQVHHSWLRPFVLIHLFMSHPRLRTNCRGLKPLSRLSPLSHCSWICL
jgi:hypothetical protein